MHFRCHVVTHPVEAVENHAAFIVELRELVFVKHKAVFTVADNLHVGFEHLSREVLAEHKRNIIFQSVACSELNVVVKLLEGAEQHHAGCFRFLAASNHFFVGFVEVGVSHALLWFFHKHLRAEVHELGRTEIFVGVEKLFASKF